MLHIIIQAMVIPTPTSLKDFSIKRDMITCERVIHIYVYEDIFIFIFIFTASVVLVLIFS